VYNNTNVTNVTYINRQVPGAVIAVPATAFVQSQPVSRVAVRMSNEMVVNAPVTPVAAFAPVQASVIGAAAPAGSKPPTAVLERPIMARRAPPAAPVSFASKELLLATNPGKPLDAAALRNLKRASPVAVAKIKVIAPAQSASPVTAPPESRGKAERRGKPGELPVATPGTPPPPPAAAPPELRGKPEPRGKPEQRGKPGEPSAAKAPSPPPPPVAAPLELRGKAEQHGKEPKADAAKSGNKKSDEQLNFDEEEKKRKP
jgi:hypothetical protein